MKRTCSALFFLEIEHKRSTDGVMNKDKRSISLAGFKSGDDVETYRDPQGQKRIRKSKGCKHVVLIWG